MAFEYKRNLNAEMSLNVAQSDGKTFLNVARSHYVAVAKN